MLKKKNYILLCLLTLASMTAMAQQATVRAEVQPSEIYIGEHAIISLEVIAPKGQSVEFPRYESGNHMIKGIEVLLMLPPDTIMTEVMTINQKYLVTSFDSALYYFQYIAAVVNSDTLKSNDFGFKVTTPELSESTNEYLEMLKSKQTDSLDFARLQIADIKDIQPPRFVFTDYVWAIVFSMLAILLLLLSFVAYILWKRKKREGYFFSPKIVPPAHIVAISDLNKLKAKKLAQQGMEKEFYTQLSDILRIYIGNRYHTINATEMFTDQILESVHKATNTSSSDKGLEQILRLSDLVKFAKYIPLTDENDLSIMNAYLFVNQTKQEETVPVDEENKDTNDTTKAKQGETVFPVAHDVNNKIDKTK